MKFSFLFPGLTNAYAAGAKMHGAKIIEDCPIDTILVDERKGRSVSGVQTKLGKVTSLQSVKSR